MLINASLLALVGIAIYAKAAPELFWYEPPGNHHFASFAYQNHAGEFFFLMFSIGIGMLFRHVFLDRSARRWMTKTILLGTACVIMLVSVHLALCAASSLLVWLVIAVAAVYACSTGTRHLSPATRLQIMIGMFMFCTFAYYGITGPARHAVITEIKVLADQAAVLEDIDCRFWKVVKAWHMSLDNVWFGVGGWAYRYLGPFYLPQEARFLMLGIGRGNVHNDSMQFLAEFGFVGFGMITSWVCILLYRIIRHPMWSHGMYTFMLLGLALLYIHSMADLPFRNPAILLTSAICLVALASYTQLSNQRRDQSR
jgi:hypothetical protein